MKLTQVAIDLIKKFEGCRLRAYPDPGTGYKPYTIGYGATGDSINADTVWTQDQADADLVSRLTTLVGELASMIKMDLTDNQTSALLSLVYNIGLRNFQQSTLLKMINAGAIRQAADEFEKWNKAGGHSLNGLMNRRLDEKKLYLTA